MPLHFMGHHTQNKNFSLKITSETGILQLPKVAVPVIAIYFPSNLPPNWQHMADKYSELDIQGKLENLLKIFYSIYPFIKDLSILTKQGKGMIYGRIEKLKNKQPLSLISYGVNKLLAILLQLESQSNLSNCILIDEIDNGFYYDRMNEICEALYLLAKQNNIQIFMTTHSQEFLMAMAHVASKNNNQKDFCLIRTERENNKIVANRFPGAVLRHAMEYTIEQHVEIRGNR